MVAKEAQQIQALSVWAGQRHLKAQLETQALSAAGMSQLTPPHLWNTGAREAQLQRYAQQQLAQPTFRKTAAKEAQLPEEAVWKQLQAAQLHVLQMALAQVRGSRLDPEKAEAHHAYSKPSKAGRGVPR